MDALAIGGGLLVLISIIGASRYNKLRRNWYGIVGVGGSYFILLGIMLLVALISELVNAIAGHPSEMEAGIGQVIFMIVVMLAALAYLVFIMLTRCSTVKQRILLPIVAVMIGMGFCWRLLLSIFAHIPMSNGAPEGGTAGSPFPSAVEDDHGEIWHKTHEDNEKAEYLCDKTGARQTFWITGNYVAFPNGWREV